MSDFSFSKNQTYKLNLCGLCAFAVKNYFLGPAYDLKRAVIKSHTRLSEGINSTSLGEWGSFRLGPNEIMSMPGYLSPIMAHSSPA